MKNIKMASVVASFLLGAIALTGCTGRTIMNNGNDAASIVAVTAKELQAPVLGEQSPSVQAAAKGANDFAFKLSGILAEDAGNKNLVSSPYSVWLPLAALVNATSGDIRTELLTALNASGISVEDLNIAASRMLYDLTNVREKEFAKEYGEKDYNNPLKIANALFVGNNVTPNKTFAQVFMDYYRGSVMKVDFGSKEAVDAVNNWASDNTEGLIKNIVNEFDPETVAAIANAIYFSDRWEREFNVSETREDAFHSPNGETKAFYMLREGDGQTYYEDDKLQAMPLRFSSGGGLYILLPKDGDATSLLSSLTSDYFEEIQNDAIRATGKLLLPRFNIDGDILKLTDTLKALGVPLFDEALAPLTGGLLEETIPVWLSDAAHKAVIKVDEKGTTAAAVTVMTANGTSMPQPTEPFVMDCNKPFVFVLYSDTYDAGTQVLFTGMVNEP